MPAIRMQGLGKRFGDRWAVRDVDLDIEAGQTVAFIGPSGCGKTTTLRMLNRLIEPSAGRVEILGREARGVEPASLRRQIGYVIQDVGLFAHYTVRRNVGVVPELLGWPRHRIEQRTEELLNLLGLPPDEFSSRYPQQLSGGQRQRVGIARALCADPPLVLMDEPFGSLDPITREAVQDQFLGLSRQLDKTFVLVTHDIFEAVRLADRIVVLKDGRIVQVAAPAELVRKPVDEFVEAMLGRHRYQLKLMTLEVAQAVELLERSGTVFEFEPGDAEVVDLEPTMTVWEALDRLELTRARFVQVTHRAKCYLMRRDQLLDAVVSS